jgi:hypothetical protein
LPNVNWVESLEGALEASWSERSVGGKFYDLDVDGRTVVLGIHKPIDTDFMTSLDEEAERVSDLLVADADSPGLFYSTAAIFMPQGGVVGVALGGTKSPRYQSIPPFLEAFWPQEDGEWRIEPLMDGDQIEALRRDAKGALELSTRFSTRRSVFSVDGEFGLVSMGDQVAETIGADIDVEIRISLSPESRGAASKSRMLELINESLPRISAKENKTKAVVLLEGGVEEELELVTHRLAATVEVDDSVSESMLFSVLVQHLKDVSGSMEDRVQEILEG